MSDNTRCAYLCGKMRDQHTGAVHPFVAPEVPAATKVCVHTRRLPARGPCSLCAAPEGPTGASGASHALTAPAGVGSGEKPEGEREGPTTVNIRYSEGPGPRPLDDEPKPEGEREATEQTDQELVRHLALLGPEYDAGVSVLITRGFFRQLLAHDALQRAEIERLNLMLGYGIDAKREEAALKERLAAVEKERDILRAEPWTLATIEAERAAREKAEEWKAVALAWLRDRRAEEQLPPDEPPNPVRWRDYMDARESLAGCAFREEERMREKVERERDEAITALSAHPGGTSGFRERPCSVFNCKTPTSPALVCAPCFNSEKARADKAERERDEALRIGAEAVAAKKKTDEVLVNTPTRSGYDDMKHQRDAAEAEVERLTKDYETRSPLATCQHRPQFFTFDTPRVCVWCRADAAEAEVERLAKELKDRNTTRDFERDVEITRSWMEAITLATGDHYRPDEAPVYAVARLADERDSLKSRLAACLDALRGCVTAMNLWAAEEDGLPVCGKLDALGAVERAAAALKKAETP